MNDFKKSDLLCNFALILYNHDPAGLESPYRTEYESEALSILSRFNEMQLHAIDSDEESIITTAIEIVINVFKFWFDGMTFHTTFKDVTLDLLKCYIESYPTLEIGN